MKEVNQGGVTCLPDTRGRFRLAGWMMARCWCWCFLGWGVAKTWCGGVSTSESTQSEIGGFRFRRKRLVDDNNVVKKGMFFCVEIKGVVTCLCEMLLCGCCQNTHWCFQPTSESLLRVKLKDLCESDWSTTTMSWKRVYFCGNQGRYLRQGEG